MRAVWPSREPRGSPVTCPGRPWRGSPSLGTTLDSGLTKVLARCSKSAGRRRIPATLCQPPAPPSSAPGAHALTRPRGWPRSGLSQVRAPPTPNCGPPGHPRAMAHWGMEGAQGCRHQRGPGAGHQRPGMAARRVAHGQAQGMKGSLSSGDTEAVSSGLPLPRP